MRVIIILMVQYTLIHTLNVHETTNKIKLILNRYKSTCRRRRCVNLFKEKKETHLDNFAEKTVKFMKKTERYGDYLRSYNVSDCAASSSRNNTVYLKQHVLNGLLIHEDVPHTHWHEYKSVFSKNYLSHDHEMSALSVWRENLRRVAQHNKDYLAGRQSYALHLNHFGDWDITFYMKRLLKLFQTFPMFDPAEDHHKTTYRKTQHRKTPLSVDWRAKGYKPRLEEQWQCGACYAFAVSHALQAQLFMKHGDWNEVSPQQIVDCSVKDGNYGCDGGSLQAALRYSAREGLTMESHYPYTGKKSLCKYNKVFANVRVKRWATLPFEDEEAMEKALATIGPLAVAVNAAPFTFQLYRSGIYDDPFCFPSRLNHAMLLVGYTPDYWILLNWWGKNWGEDGYMRIRRGFNRCGVANMATYVEI